MTPHGPWTILETHAVYRDRWIEVTRADVLRPDGLPGSHCVVHIAAGVSVLALDEDENVFLTEEFHYAVGRVTLEAVSGATEADETPADTARRELREELGIEAVEWIDLGPLDPGTTILRAPTRLFLAHGLQFGPPAPEGTEQIRCVKMALAEAVEAVLENRITHAPTCVLILQAAFRTRRSSFGSLPGQP